MKIIINRKYLNLNSRLIRLLLIFSILFFSINSINAIWWNNSFDYKQEINISTISGITENNYQVNLILNNSNVGSNFNWSRNCNDIRFINQSDNYIFSYFIDNCSNLNQNASIWIKIPINITTSNLIIDMYYGNNLVSNLSNGTLTFDFYDDFSVNLSKWTKEKNSSNLNIVNGYLNISGGTTSGDFGHSSLGSSATYNNFLNGIIEGKLFLSSNAISEIVFRGNYSANTGYKSRSDARGGQGISHLKPPYSGWSLLSGCSVSGIAVNNNIWSDFQIIVNGTSFTINVDGQSNTCSDNQYTVPGEISLQNHYGSFTAYDDIRVRKYFSNTINKYFGVEQIINKSINFVNPTLINNSYINTSFTFINISSNINLLNATLEINNNLNYSMFGSGNNWYYNLTNLNVGNYTYRVYGYYLNNSFNLSEIRVLNINPLNIIYTNPTPLNTSLINSTDSIYVNLSINSVSNFSSYVDFNGKLLNYLNFENISGSTVYDLSSYSNNGILENGALITNITKIRGNYSQLDGSNDDVAISGVPVNISDGAKTTVEFWMYWDGIENGMPFSWNGANYDLWFNSGCFGFNTFNGNVLGVSSSGLANGWHHIVATFYNGLASPTNNELYIDSVKQNIYDCKNSVGSSRTVNSNPRISGHSGSYNFKGKIDEFKIWDGVLSQKEVNNSYFSHYNTFTNYRQCPKIYK